MFRSSATKTTSAEVVLDGFARHLCAGSAG
jgi:hypothetical protein